MASYKTISHHFSQATLPRNIMAQNFHLEANQLLQWRDEGHRKMSFNGTIFRPDSTIILQELTAAREKWRATRTVRTYSGRVIELANKLSEWEVNRGSLPAFFAQYPEAVDTVTYRPGEWFKEAVAHQPITDQEWHLLHDDIDSILAIDPFNRHRRTPFLEDWSTPEVELFNNEVEEAGSSSTAFQPFDPDFDCGTISSPPGVSIKTEIKKEE